MLISLVFSFLLLFSGAPDSKKESPKLTASFCQLTAGPVKISELRNCEGVTLSIAPDAGEKYGSAKIVGYTIIISPKKSKAPPAIENATGSAISEFAKNRVAALVPGDMVILANVKIQTQEGIENLKQIGCGGTVYNIVAE